MRRSLRWTRPLVFCHAVVPFPFQFQVRHQAQESPFEFLPAEPGIQQSASWRSHPLQVPDLRPVTVPRRREDPLPQPRYVLLVDRPVDDVPLAHALRSVHRLRHPTCPSARLAALASALTGSPGSRQLPFRPGTRPVSGRLSTAPALEESGQQAMVSRCLSAAGISFCGHPSPARDSAPLAIGLPAQPRWTATGYHVPHTRDAAGKGALSTPGPAVLTRTSDNPRPAACRPSTARVLSPRHSRHPSGAASYEASVKGSRSSPARPSPHPWPPDDSGNPPAFPRAPHPRGQDPRTHAGAGTGSEHKPGTTPPALRHAGPPISEVHSQHVRPRVALIIWHLLADPSARFADLGPGWHQRKTDTDRRTRSLMNQLRALHPDADVNITIVPGTAA